MKHLRKHEKDKNLLFCAICKEKFYGREFLEEHTREHHTDIPGQSTSIEYEPSPAKVKTEIMDTDLDLDLDIEIKTEITESIDVKEEL